MNDKRHENINRKDNQLVFKLGFYEIDETVKWYFENVIKPSIDLENGSVMNVPVIYGTPERWKSVQKDGYYRDKRSKQIMCPIIMFKRNEISNNRSYTRNIDANNPQMYIYHENQYNRNNQYDLFSVLVDRKPVKQLQRLVIPNFIKTSYECSIWTNKVVHMNKLIEAINYAESSYWGDQSRFRFHCKIDSFSPSIEISDGEDRMIKTNFTIELDGYIIPDNIQKILAQGTQQSYTVSKIIIDEQIL